MEQEFIKFLKMVEETPNVYLALVGDLIDNTTKNSVGNSYANRYRPSEQKKLMAKLLEPVANRILVAVQGNHEERSEREVDDCPLYDILCKLDKENLYRRNIAFVNLRFGDNKIDGSRNPSYILAVTHGSGGGIYTGGALNRNERFGYVLSGVDALISAHTHKPVVSIPSRIVVDARHSKVSVQPFYCLTATSWLEYGGYAAKKMLLPSTHRLETMTLRGTKKEIIITI